MAFFSWDNIHCSFELFQNTGAAGNEICFEHCGGKFNAQGKRCYKSHYSLRRPGEGIFAPATI